MKKITVEDAVHGKIISERDFSSESGVLYFNVTFNDSKGEKLLFWNKDDEIEWISKRSSEYLKIRSYNSHYSARVERQDGG